MLISGIKKTTLLDYPGKIACIIFTAGCNLRCKFCYNPEFVLPEKINSFDEFIPEEVFFNFLNKKKLLIDGVVICGGEPTIQKDLYSFCKKIKTMGFLVKLDTNGQNPNLLKKLINEKSIDYVAMDIKGDFKNLDDLVGISIDKNKYLESIEILKNSDIDYEFRTTLIKNYHSLDNFEDLVKQISGAKKYFLQNYKTGNSLDINFNGKSFLNKELIEFKKIANNYVLKCEIRL